MDLIIDMFNMFEIFSFFLKIKINSKKKYFKYFFKTQKVVTNTVTNALFNAHSAIYGKPILWILY